LVNTIMKFLLRALAVLFGGSSIVVVVALMIRPDDALIMLAPAVFFLLLAGALWYWSSAPDSARWLKLRRWKTSFSASAATFSLSPNQR